MQRERIRRFQEQQRMQALVLSQQQQHPSSSAMMLHDHGSRPSDPILVDSTSRPMSNSRSASALLESLTSASRQGASSSRSVLIPKSGVVAGRGQSSSRHVAPPVVPRTVVDLDDEPLLSRSRNSKTASSSTTPSPATSDKA